MEKRIFAVTRNRNATQKGTYRVVATGDVVIVHGEDQPRGKWRIGKVESLFTGSDGCVRGAVARVKTKGGKRSNLGVQYNDCAPWKSSSEMMMQKLQLAPEGQILSHL